MAVLRIVVPVLLLSGLFFLVDFREIIAVLAGLDLLYVFYLFLIGYLVIWLSCLKWKLFIEASGHTANLRSLMYYYTVGYFFNMFAPSFIAGDISRSLHLGEELKSKKNAFISTFLERFTGLFAMSILGASFVTFGSGATAGVEIAIWIVFLFSASLALICFNRGLSKMFFSYTSGILDKYFTSKRGVKFKNLLERVDQGMAFARNDLKLFLRAMYLSFAFHMLTVLNTWVAAKAIGWEADVASLFVVVPLILLVGMIPISPNGWGIQEGAFLFFLQRIGANKAQGLSVGLVLRAKVVIISLIGGVIFLFLRKKNKR